MAIQSGEPGTSNTTSGFSVVIATRTLAAFTPGLGGRVGLRVCAREGKRIGRTISTRSMERILAKLWHILVLGTIASIASDAFSVFAYCANKIEHEPRVR